MPTLGDLKTHIARDLARPGGTLAVAIGQAVQDAIRYYQREKFPQNWQEVDLTTVIGQHVYPVATGGRVLDLDRGEHLGQRYSLRIRPANVLAARYDANLRGDPLMAALSGNSIVLHPIPHTVVDLVLRLNISPEAPTADDQAGFWTEDAYSLIRHHAKADLFLNTLRGPAAGEGQLARQQAADELRSLHREAVFAQRPYPPSTRGGWV